MNPCLKIPTQPMCKTTGHATAVALVVVMSLAMSLASPAAWAQTDPKAGLDCKAPTTQARMNDCAYEDFLAAGAGYAESSKQISSKLTGKQRDLFRRAQKAWIGYSTAACEFETSGLQGGSAQGMARWQCAARMTRARVAELAAMGNCAEGDLACVRFKK